MESVGMLAPDTKSNWWKSGMPDNVQHLNSRSRESSQSKYVPRRTATRYPIGRYVDAPAAFIGNRKLGV